VQKCSKLRHEHISKDLCTRSRPCSRRSRRPNHTKEDMKTAGKDVKQAGKATGQAAKNTAKATKKETKKAVTPRRRP